MTPTRYRMTAALFLGALGLIASSSALLLVDATTASPAAAWTHCGTPQAEPDCPKPTTTTEPHPCHNEGADDKGHGCGGGSGNCGEDSGQHGTHDDHGYGHNPGCTTITYPATTSTTYLKPTTTTTVPSSTTSTSTTRPPCSSSTTAHDDDGCPPTTTTPPTIPPTTRVPPPVTVPVVPTTPAPTTTAAPPATMAAPPTTSPPRSVPITPTVHTFTPPPALATTGAPKALGWLLLLGGLLAAVGAALLKLNPRRV